MDDDTDSESESDELSNDERTPDTIVEGKTLAEWGKEGGAPKGNDNAVGNKGGDGAPLNNQNRATHHLESDPEKLLPWLEENKPHQYEWVLGKYASYLEDAPFGDGSAKADKLLETVVCEYIIWHNRGIQVRDGIVQKTHIKGSDGELVEVDAEIPHNQAINRMDRQVMSKLKDLGIFDEDSSGASGDMESDDYIIVIEDAETESEQADGD